MSQKNFNPEMLILAREFRGLTQSTLAKALEISQGRLSKIESGLLSPTDDLIGPLSSELGFPEKFFCRQDRRSGLPLTYYRKRKSAPKTAERQLCALVNLYKLHLHEFLRSVEIDECSVPVWDADEGRSVRDIARDVRAMLGVPPGPVMNMTRLLEDAGVLIVRTDFGTSKIDGFSLKFDASLPPVVFVSDQIPGDRLRFTLAHELGHLVMHHGALSIPSDAMEPEADEFAAEFLMPEREIGGQLRRVNLEKLASLKLYWKVSMQALLYQAQHLGEITPNQAKNLWIRMSKFGYRQNEPVQIDVEEPTLLPELIQIHRELGFSDGELQEVLMLGPTDFEKMYSSSDAKHHLRVV